MSEHPRQQQQYAEPTQHDDAPVTSSKTVKPDRTLLAEVVTINRPAQELYDFWRRQENLVQVMDNIEAIEPIDETRSRWTVKAPAGGTVSWESVITSEVPGKEITWQSAPDADVANSGRIEFREAGQRGTIVRATIAYDPPGGRVGELIAKLFQREPRVQARRDLHRFKQLMETGEIATGARNHRILAERKGE
jgi:uncharacterized membrane protein